MKNSPRNLWSDQCLEKKTKKNIFPKDCDGEGGRGQGFFFFPMHIIIISLQHIARHAHRQKCVLVLPNQFSYQIQVVCMLPGL